MEEQGEREVLLAKCERHLFHRNDRVTHVNDWIRTISCPFYFGLIEKPYILDEEIGIDVQVARSMQLVRHVLL